jgi:cell wall-associated NlpC family hydrolase
MRLPARFAKLVTGAVAAAVLAGAAVAGLAAQASASARAPERPAAAASGQAQAQAIVKAADKWLTKPVTAYCWGGGGNTGPTHGDGEVAGIYTGPKGQSGCYAKTVAGFDCSGLVKYAIYQALGISLYHLAQDQSEGITDTGPDVHPAIVSVANLEAGDVVVFGNSKTDIKHDGIYVGGGYIVNAIDYKNNGDNGTDNEYWGVAKVPLSWAKGGFTFEAGIRYWKTGPPVSPSPSPARPSPSPTKAGSKSPAPSPSPSSPPSSPGPAGNWAQAGHDPAQDYFNHAEDTIGQASVRHLIHAWSAAAGLRAAQPLVYKDKVFRLTGKVTGTGTGTDVLTATRLSGGAPLWTRSLGGNGLDTLYAAGDGKLLYGTAGSADTLVALSAATGAHLWTETDTGFAGGSGEVLIDGTTIIDGVLSLQVLKASDGAQVWSATDGAGAGGPDSFAVSDGKVVRTASIGGKTYLEARNEATGDVEWKTLAPCSAADDSTSLAIGSATTVYLSDSCSGDLRAYSLSTGKAVWTAASADGQAGLGMATNGSDVYLMGQSAEQAVVTAYSGGKTVWQAGLADGTSAGSPPTLANGVLYVTVDGSGATEQTTALNASTGATLWTSPVMDERLDTPFAADGYLLVGAEVFKLS